MEHKVIDSARFAEKVRAFVEQPNIVIPPDRYQLNTEGGVFVADIRLNSGNMVRFNAEIVDDYALSLPTLNLNTQTLRIPDMF